MRRLNRRLALFAAVALLCGLPVVSVAEPLPLVTDVELQPLVAQVRRVVKALDLLGSPLSNEQRAKVSEALTNEDAAEAVKQFQQVLHHKPLRLYNQFLLHQTPYKLD